MTCGVSKLVSLYERGLLTRVEVFTELLHLGAASPPANLAAGLPAGLLAELRHECERFPPCPPSGGVLFLTSVCNGPGYDHERAQREAEARWRAGLAAWQGFFGVGGSGSADPGAAAARGPGGGS